MTKSHWSVHRRPGGEVVVSLGEFALALPENAAVEIAALQGGQVAEVVRRHLRSALTESSWDRIRRELTEALSLGPWRDLRDECRRVATRGFFPFGEPVTIVEQADRAPKRVFVLGVYASAVHARWLDKDGKQVVAALAVASEPEIFWRGEGAADIIGRIEVPADVGRLEPAATNLNGPSGRALDELYLAPLGVTREQAWLCDLVPWSGRNPGQAKAIARAYDPLVESHGLPPATFEPPPAEFADDQRRAEILAELVESDAEVLVLLGDQPIRWFLAAFEPRWSKLSDFGTGMENYGLLHDVDLDGHCVKILRVAHPRQAGALGAHSGDWRAAHERWVNEVAPGLFRI